jgi:hypothetical protein
MFLGIGMALLLELPATATMPLAKTFLGGESHAAPKIHGKFHRFSLPKATPRTKFFHWSLN